MLYVIAFCLLAGVLLVAAVMDLRTERVDNRLTYSAMIGGLVFWTIGGLMTGEGLLPLQHAAIALAAGLVGFTILFAMGGLGGGDVKLMAAVGAIGGTWQLVLSTTIYAFIIAMVIAVYLMFRHRIVKRTLARLFGAALLAAGKTKPQFPQDSPRVAFALAIAIGGMLAGAEHLLGLVTPWSQW